MQRSLVRKVRLDQILDAKDIGLTLYLFKLIEFTATAAWADLARFGPGLGGTQVRPPEGPGTALPGACMVDRAFAALAIEEDAVAIGKLD